ncbi:ABC transporter permease, partial [Salmonella enterica subsp. enterica]|nr:ABC transporter permease [Salmonella enterica subsp. enterica serovar Paratyphi A]
MASQASATATPPSGRRPRRKSKAETVALGVGGVALSTAFTFLGLLAITFFIGRIVPIDPVLAV